MTSPRKFAALCLLALLCLPPQAAVTGEDGGPAAGPRTEYQQQGYAEIELKGSGTSYTANYTQPLPSNALVSYAGVELAGRSVKGSLATLACDYSDEAGGHKAYKGIVSDFLPLRTAVQQLQGGEFTSDEYTAVTSSDDQRAESAGDFSGNNDGFQLFKFKVPMDVSSSVDVTWEGLAGDPWWGYIGTFAVYIWNNGSRIWELVGTNRLDSDSQLSLQFTGDWYIDNRSVFVLAICTDGYSIMTDFVSVTARGYPYHFPKNPSMDVGADGTSEWSLTEMRFDYTVPVTETALAIALQDASAGVGARFANITIRFKSETPGKIKISGFFISYTAPPWCSGIPGTFHLAEDTPAPKLINLNSYFVDDNATVNLTYSVSYQQDSRKLQAELDPDGHSLGFRLPTRNWWGAMKFRVKATDGDGLTAESGNFTVTVDPVNDQPVIQPIGDQRVEEDSPFSLLVRARDPDMDLDPAETMTFSANTKLFKIDPRTGWINFTPAQENVGTYPITVTVTDAAGAGDSQNFTLVVEDVEDKPVLKPIPDQTAKQDQPFSYSAVATDPDVPFGDSLNFSDDTPLFDIDRATGLISFIPSVEAIGIYRVNITVKDTRGGSDKKAFTLTVLNYHDNLNRPPSIERIPDQTAVEGTPFTLTVNASDPDSESGDYLTFSDNCPVFNIGALNGTIFFVPRASDIAVYNVKITATDQEDFTATVTFRLTVMKLNHAPVIISHAPAAGTKVLQNGEVVLSADATDADGDRLNYTWMEGQEVLGFGSSILVRFSQKGVHVVTLVVSDGRLSTTNETPIEVVDTLPQDKKSPGFEAVLGAAALIGALVAAAGRRRR